MLFNFYTILLMVSGLMLIIVGATLPGQSKGSRIVNVLVGLAFFGYGFYLEFIFTGGKYRVFFYAFILPILLIVRTFQARKAAKAAREEHANQVAAATPESQMPQQP